MRINSLVGGILILILVKKFINKRTAKGTSDAASSDTEGCDSSSSSFPSSGWVYDVFLSYRGEDTRRNFPDQLYYALVQQGIRTFRDDEDLSIGEKIYPEIRSAIHQSRIAIPILSESYPSSTWCLHELSEIVKCMKQEGQRKITVMPVFYRVEPSDVRHQIGSYKEAFQNHQKKRDPETVEGWKDALREVSSLSGWAVEKIADGHEAELIRLIVERVCCELRNTPLNVFYHDLVGIDSRVEEVMNLLRVESNDVRIVGICGLGGIGKTTIAKCVYNLIYHKFDGCCFLANARGTFQMLGLVHLQTQLIGNILNLNDPKITDVDQGIQMIKETLSKKRVLIVFDDIDFDSKEIIGTHDWYRPGSKIIITTRDRRVLDVVDGVYEPQEMDSHQSLQIFSKHAFKTDQPPPRFLNLSQEVIEVTKGLPLTNEVIGSSLFGIEDSSAWEYTIEKLKNLPHGEEVKEYSNEKGRKS